MPALLVIQDRHLLLIIYAAHMNCDFTPREIANYIQIQYNKYRQQNYSKEVRAVRLIIQDL
jgi:hypothetical protein